MVQLHYFNPGHETAVLQGSPNYTPSLTVRKMMEDLALLPAWYASAGDYVFTEGIQSPYFLSKIPITIRPDVTVVSPEKLKEISATIPPLEAQPWGLSPQILHRFEQISHIPGLRLDVPVWKEKYRQLTHRKTAACCLGQLKSLLPDYGFPESAKFFDDPFLLEEFLIAHPGLYVLKTPFSSTGRGLLWLDTEKYGEKDRSWIQGAIKRQGSISIEPQLNKITDSGWEFYADGKGKVTFKGIAPFGTNTKGAYQGTAVINQSILMKQLETLIGKDKLQQTIEALEEVLSGIYGNEYKGCIGVDTFIYITDNGYEQLHPCVEINMRNTMGNLAIHLNRIIHPGSEGNFYLSYHSHSTGCNEHHKQMKKAYPFSFKEGKIKEGYFTLCPVTKETRYKAYLIVQ